MKIKSVKAFVEYSLGANPLLHDLVEENFPVEDGMIAVRDRPSLGITVRGDFSRPAHGRPHPSLPRGRGRVGEGGTP